MFRSLFRQERRRSSRLSHAGSRRSLEQLEERSLLSVGLVKDINQVDTQPANLTNAGATLFFTATDPGNGKVALWKSNGLTSGTVLVADIPTPAYATSPNVSATSLTAIGATVYYEGYDTAKGESALFKSDGTTAGTGEVAPFNGSFSAVNGLIAAGQKFYFTVNDNANGNSAELWESDGTAKGTTHVPVLTSTAATANLTAVGNMLFFSVYDSLSGGTQLWVTDGTANGTIMLQTLKNATASNLTNLGGELYFDTYNSSTLSAQIVRSDGTSAGTVALTLGTITPQQGALGLLSGEVYFTGINSTGAAGSQLYQTNGSASGTVALTADSSFSGTFANFTNVPGSLLFTANDATYGDELWGSTGTAKGTSIIRDINPGAASGFGSMSPYASPSSAAAPFTVIGGVAYFAANDGSHGLELWKSDSTPAGTILVDDIDPGSASSSPQELTNFGGTLYFSAHDSSGANQLWSSGGSAATTTAIKSFTPTSTQSSFPSYLTSVNGTLYFAANDGVDGEQIFVSNGSSAGTVPIFNLGSNFFSGMIVGFNGLAAFSTFSSLGVDSVYATDGTVAGTTQIATGTVLPSSLVAVGKTLYFATSEVDSTTGLSFIDLWKSDGTKANTVEVAAIHELGQSIYNYSGQTNVNGTLYFYVSSQGVSNLWRSDGSAGGTFQVASFTAKQTSSVPQALTAVSSNLFFVIDQPNSAGQALWVSNGTAGGTVQLHDFPGDSTTPNPLASLTNVNGTLEFVVNSSTDAQLWKSNAISGGTVMLKDFPIKNSGSSYPTGIVYPTVSNGLLYFAAGDGTGEEQLWRSDGTGSGTFLLVDFGTNLSLTARGFTDVNGTLYLEAPDSATGNEAIWTSTGTAATTTLVADLPSPGQSGSSGSYNAGYAYSSNFLNVNGTLYFTESIFNPATQSSVDSLWQSDGSAKGTGLDAGNLPSASNFTAAGSTLFFVGQDRRGSELWAASNPSVIATTPPSLSSIPTQTVPQGSTVSVTATATVPNKDPYFFILGAAPTGATIDPGTGVFTWAVPANQKPANSTATVIVIDANTLLSTSQTFTISVYSSSATPPVLSPIANQTVDQGGTVSFKASASGPANDPLTFSLGQGSPANAKIDPSTGAFTWPVPNDQPPGVDQVTVIVTDTTSNISVSQVASITVFAPPTIDPIGAQKVDVGNTLSLTVTANESDAGSLVFSLANGAPSGAVINSSSGVFSWAVPAGQAPGNDSVTVIVTDSASGLSASDTFVIAVLNAPTLNPIPAQTVGDGQTLTFHATATETDTGALTFSLATGSPSGASIDSKSGVFTWPVPLSQPAGNILTTVIVTDAESGLTNSESVSITVFAPPQFTAIPDQVVNQGNTLTLTAKANASDAGPLTYSLPAGDGNPSGAVIDPKTGVFSWSVPSSQSPAKYPTTVMVVDATSGLSNTDSFTITVYAAPTLKPISAQTVDQGKTLTLAVSANSTDSGTLTYNLAAGAPAGAAIDPASGLFTWSVPVGQPPIAYPVTINVSDQASKLSAQETFTVLVYAPPSLAPIGPLSVNVGNALSFSASATETDDGPLTFALAHGAPAGASIDPTTGLFNWSVAAAQPPGAFPVTVTVTDGASNFTTSQMFLITVFAPPALNPIPNQSITAGAGVSLAATSSETDAGALTYALGANAPAGATIDPTTGLFHWSTPASEPAGSYPITVVVTDHASNLSAARTFSIAVASQPSGPPPGPISPGGGGGGTNPHGKHAKKTPHKHVIPVKHAHSAGRQHHNQPHPKGSVHHGKKPHVVSGAAGLVSGGAGHQGLLMLPSISGHKTHKG